MNTTFDQRVPDFPAKEPLIPTSICPILNLNPESLETLPLDKVTCPLTLTTVPSAKADKEAILSNPATASAPNLRLPDAFAQYLVLDPLPDFTPIPPDTLPFAYNLTETNEYGGGQ